MATKTKGREEKKVYPRTLLSWKANPYYWELATAADTVSVGLGYEAIGAVRTQVGDIVVRPGYPKLKDIVFFLEREWKAKFHYCFAKDCYYIEKL